jgi:energy-coupling factor transporter ATP-binding protein EcfA2
MAAPYLRRVWLEPSRVADRTAYPFCLPFLSDGFELSFESAITIIVGENGTGKSTLLEGIAVLAGFDEGGGGKGLSAGRSFECAGEDGRGAFEGAARELAAEDYQWLVLSGGKLFLDREISRRGQRRGDSTCPWRYSA